MASAQEDLLQVSAQKESEYAQETEAEQDEGTLEQTLDGEATIPAHVEDESIEHAQAAAKNAKTQKSQDAPGVFEATPKRLIVGIACVLVGGTLWGANGSVSKILMEGYHATPLWIACVREIIAGAVFLLCAAVATPHSLKKAVTSWREYPKFIFAAITCAMLVQCAYLMSIHYTNAGTATVLQTVNLLMVLAYVCWHAHRKPTGKEVIGTILAFGGVLLLATGGSFTSLSIPLPGLIWGLVDAFSCACLAILPLGLIAEYGNMVFNGLTFLISGILLLPFVRPWENVPSFDARGWWLMAFTVVMGTFIAFWLFMAGVVRIGSMRATLLGTIEPVVATITAVMWTGSVFVPADIVGFIMILIMVFLVQ